MDPQNPNYQQQVSPISPGVPPVDQSQVPLMAQQQQYPSPGQQYPPPGYQPGYQQPQPQMQMQPQMQQMVQQPMAQPMQPPPLQFPNVSAYPQTSSSVIGYSSIGAQQQLPTPQDFFQGVKPSVLPRQIVYVPNDSALPKIEITRKNSKIISYDPQISQSADMLLAYFFIYGNEKPQLTMTITGTHTEKRTRTIKDANGKEIQQEYTETITDFRVNLDLNAFIAETWDFCWVKGQDLKESVEEFIRSEKYLKQINCQKTLSGWNTAYINAKVTEFIRGYCKFPQHHALSIQYQVNNCVIKAKNDSVVMKAHDDTCIKVLCFLTCLCIIFYPVYDSFRKSFKESVLFNYPLVVNEDQFLQGVMPQIQDAVINRRQTPQLVCSPNMIQRQ